MIKIYLRKSTLMTHNEFNVSQAFNSFNWHVVFINIQNGLKWSGQCSGFRSDYCIRKCILCSNQNINFPVAFSVSDVQLRREEQHLITASLVGEEKERRKNNIIIFL